MTSVGVNDKQTSSPNRRQSLIHLLIYTSLLIPLACIPYIPIRRHLFSLKKSVHVISNNTLSLQRELNYTQLQAQTLREEKLQLLEELRNFQRQLKAIKDQAIEAESCRRHNDDMVKKRIDAVEELTTTRENARSRVEEELRTQVDRIKTQVERDRPVALLQDLSTSLADVASFIEEVEIQQGWSQSIPRDRGINRMRQLALKLHIAKSPKECNAQ